VPSLNMTFAMTANDGDHKSGDTMAWSLLSATIDFLQ